MPIYVAMLRGINVGRGKVVKMERLRASLGKLGFGGVRTYVQSGNVVFQSEQKSAAEISKKIEAKILRDFGFAVPVILKTSCPVPLSPATVREVMSPAEPLSLAGSV